MRMKRLQVNFDFLRLSIRSVIGPKRHLEADSILGVNSDWRDDFDSGTDSDSTVDSETNSDFGADYGINSEADSGTKSGVDSDSGADFVIDSRN